VIGSEVDASEHYLGTTCMAKGPVESRCVSPAQAPLWLVSSTLPAGTTLEWNTAHGDEALYIADGSLVVDGRQCPSRGAVILEAGVAARAHAPETTRVIHMGPRDPTPPADGFRGPAALEGHRAHVVGPRGTFELLEARRETRFFADSTCPTCRLWLLYTSRSFAWETRVHSHSQDELIHVLTGEIKLGSLRVGPGSTLFIEAHQLYQFRAAHGGVAFLNYRRDASRMRFQGREETLVEAGSSTGMHRVVAD
jgi:quercetin dioxygenase-like cupin family protein